MKKLDEIKVFSVVLCFAVMMIHLTSTPVIYMEEKYKLTYIIVFSINKLLCFAVPGFLFLSGFKLHYKYKDKNVNIKDFYISRIKKIYIPYLIANIIYFLFYLSKGYVLYDVNSILSYIFLGTLVAHFYYIIIAMQFYFVFPFLKNFLSKYPKFTLCISLILTIIFQQFVSFYMSDRFILSYIFYFVFGMFLANNYEKYKGKLSKREVVFAVFTLFLILATYHCKYSYMSIVESYWYKYAPIINVFYVSFAILVVYYVSYFTKTYLKRIKNFICNIGDYSFHIYLYHILIMQIFDFCILCYFDVTIKEKFIYTTILLFTLTFFVPCLLKKLKKIKMASDTK